MKKQIVNRKKFGSILTTPVLTFIFLGFVVTPTLAGMDPSPPVPAIYLIGEHLGIHHFDTDTNILSHSPANVYRKKNLSMPLSQRYSAGTMSNRLVNSLIYQAQTAPVINMNKAAETNAVASQKMPLRYHFGLYGAAYGSEIAAGGLGIGIETGGSYETPIYSVGFDVRRTGVTLLITAVEIVSTSIGGRIYPNTFISPYIGGGFSINYIQGATIFEEGIESAIRPGVYGVLGIEVPHFTKYRFRFETRLDRIVGVSGGTIGVSFSRDF